MHFQKWWTHTSFDRNGRLNYDLDMLKYETETQTIRQSPVERFPLPLGAWDGLRYFIVALPGPSILFCECVALLTTLCNIFDEAFLFYVSK